MYEAALRKWRSASTCHSPHRGHVARVCVWQEACNLGARPSHCPSVAAVAAAAAAPVVACPKS